MCRTPAADSLPGPRLARRPLCLAAGLAGVPWIRTQAAAPLRVFYPAPEFAGDQRYHDLIALLRSALQRSEATQGPVQLQAAPEIMTEGRQLIELEAGRSLDVGWSSTSVEKETRLLPVRIPTRRGLLGFRLALIDRGRQPEFERVRSLADLRRLRVGQGLGWGDVEVYRANRIAVQTANYEILFRMLILGRFDLFPRGVNEAFVEWGTHSAELPALEVERTLLLYYPWPYYFFFNRRHAALARRVEWGLREMLRDGSFDAHFWAFHGESVRRARLGERHLIRLHNPLLPPDTPLGDTQLWLDPSRL